MRQRNRGRCTAIALGVLAAILAAPRAGRADAVLSGVVAATDATPVAGAFVAVTGSAGHFAAVAGEDGTWTAGTVPAGTYRIAAQAPGYAAAVATSVVVDTSPVTRDLSLTPSGAKFHALGVHGGQIANVTADGQSGVFYASTSVIPQVYRTADYGGTWTQVTLALDDATNGLATTSSGGGLATSGFPGELAVAVGSLVHYSTDYGVTWRPVSLPPGVNLPPGPAPRLLWGHAGSTSVLLLVTTAKTYRADMTAPSPGFVEQSTGYLADPNDAMTVANGTDAAWVAIVRASGALDVYDLAENPPATDVSSAGGFPAPATFVRLGGTRTADGVPPDALLVYSNAAGLAQMATKSGAGDFTTRSTATTIATCGQMPGSIGAVAPQSSGSQGTGTVSQCLVTMTAGGTPLTVQQIGGINNNTGLAFDAGYDGVANAVIISGDGGRGLVKSAAASGGVPQFPTSQDATAGTAPSSGGVAVHGFDVAVVKDVTFGPATGQIATALSGSGGALGVASADGGHTFETVVKKGGRAVAWWPGATGAWLVFSHFGGGPQLTAVVDWTSGTPPLASPNVVGSETLAAGGSFEITALGGVPGQDVLFVGGGNQVDQQGTSGGVMRVELAAGPSVADVVVIGAGVIPNAVRALAYCPSDGSDASVADVLFLATGTGGGTSSGSLVRVTDATGAAPAATVVADVPTTAQVNDVRVHCASGTVYAGAGSNAGGPSGSLWKSTDGGATFAAVPVSGAGVPPSLNMQVVAVDPADANHAMVAGNSEGFILETTDGGTSWTVVNNPLTHGGRNFLSEGVGDIEIPPATSALVARSASAAPATLVGTGGGLFTAHFAAAGGGGGCSTDAQCDDGKPCTLDTCSGGTCVATPRTGIDGAGCELGRLGPSVCTDGSVDAKLQHAIAKAVGGVQRTLAKAEASTKAKKRAKLLKKADKTLAALARKVGKSRTASTDCKHALDAQIDAVRGLI